MNKSTENQSKKKARKQKKEGGFNEKNSLNPFGIKEKTRKQK